MATTRYLADAQLETADARHPANVPMLVVRGYTPTPRRATQGHVTVERGAVVNALYKLADWLFVRTADDAVGFIPRACVEAIGPRTARDFGQQFPERDPDDVGARRGRASFSPTNTTTASSDGDGASGDESGASLRDAFGFLHLHKGTPSPPPPPPPPPSRWRDGLTSHRQSPIARGEVVKHGHTRRMYSAEEDGDLTSRHNMADSVDVTYVQPPSLAARRSRQPNGFPERPRLRSPVTVSDRRTGLDVSNDIGRNSAGQSRALYHKALPVVASKSGSRRRRRYRAMANNVSVRYRGSKSAGDDDYDDDDDDSLSDGAGARSLFDVALESSDNCSVCRGQYVNVRDLVHCERPVGSTRGRSPGGESRRRRRRAQTDPENGFADSDRPSSSDHSPRGSGTDHHHRRRRDHSCRSDQPRSSDRQQYNGEKDRNGDHVHREDLPRNGDDVHREDLPRNGDHVHREALSHNGDHVHREDLPRNGDHIHREDLPRNGDHVHREDLPRNGDHVHREDHRSGSRTRRRSASATRCHRATLTVVFDHVSQTDGDIDVRRGDIVRLLSDADSRCYWVRRENDGRKGFIPKSCAVNLREFNLDPSTKTTYL